MKKYDYYYLAKKNLLPGAPERHRIHGTIQKGSRVHVSAACGKAMASVACLLQEYGCIVTGSDSKFSPPMSDVLDAHGIARLEPSVKNIENIDLLVAGNTLAYSSLEPAAARARGIPTISGAEAVAQIFQDKAALVVAGTHGKTTTSAFLTHLLKEAGAVPAYLIGGVFQGTDDSYNIGGEGARFAIYEGDEYNCAYFDQAPKFLRYNPAAAIITSIEQDHVDLYPTYEDYRQAFQFLAEEVPADGVLIIHESAAAQLDMGRTQAPVIIYGPSSHCEAQYEILEITALGTRFSLLSKKWGALEFTIPLFGQYNVENAVSACLMALEQGYVVNDVQRAAATFQGTRERQEIIGTRADGTIIIRDYAHHPTAVAVTLEGLRQHYPGKRLVSIFEPKSASSRRKVFEERYGKAFAQADASIILYPTLGLTDKKEEFFDAGNVRTIIETWGKKAYEAPTSHEAFTILKEISQPQDVVIFMSAGDLDHIDDRFAAE
jgi:UDP-N-acetylmuramate: L-alanyl-gamma-D-glutamyl-meso-diaminopimelate ligase